VNTIHVHSLDEWLAMICIAVSGYAAFSAPYFLLVDADLADFDPRPAVRRAAPVVQEALVFAGHDLNRAAASVRHDVAPLVACFVHAVFAAREAARDAAALLILLTTAPTGDAR
jgi:hypothetical protein